MKTHKIALTAIASLLFLATAPGVIAGGKCSSKSCKNPAKAAQYQKYAESYDSQAEKAKAKGQTKLAAALEKCAAAKRKIAYGFESGNRSTLNAGYSAYKKARAELKKAKTKAYGSRSSKKSKSECDSKYKKSKSECDSKYKKSKSECDSKYKKSKSECDTKSTKSKSSGSYASKAAESKNVAAKYETLANTATDKGDVLKAGLLRQCAAASRLISKGYSNSDKRLISKGMYHLGMARSELKKLEKTSSEDAKVFASDNTDLPDTKL